MNAIKLLFDLDHSISSKISIGILKDNQMIRLTSSNEMSARKNNKE